MILPSTNDYHETEWKIGNVTYRVVVRDKIEDKSTVGLCDQTRKIIYLVPWQGKFAGMQTFIHEILHAIEKEYNAKIPHDKLDSIAQGLCDFVLQNGFMDVSE